MSTLVSRAVKALLEAAPLKARSVKGVWIFGSVARGEERPDSDVDLGVLCQPALGSSARW